MPCRDRGMGGGRGGGSSGGNGLLSDTLPATPACCAAPHHTQGPPSPSPCRSNSPFLPRLLPPPNHHSLSLASPSRGSRRHREIGWRRGEGKKGRENVRATWPSSLDCTTGTARTVWAEAADGLFQHVVHRRRGLVAMPISCSGIVQISLREHINRTP
jgi:hypothetical protein